MQLLDHLEKVIAYAVIVESGKINLAAQRLGVTQPSLTRLLQTLEQAVGMPLLIRSRSGIVPTREGELLYEFAQEIQKNSTHLATRLKHPQLPSAGHLRIGTYESLAEYLWPELYFQLQKKLPQVSISLHTDEAMLASPHELDCLVDAEPRLEDNYISYTLYHDYFQFYCAKSLLKKGKFDFEADLPLIYVPKAFDENGRNIRYHCERMELRFRNVIELDSFSSARSFALAGVGLAVLPLKLAAHSMSEALAAVPVRGRDVGQGFGRHKVCVSFLEQRRTEPTIRALTQFLISRFRR